MSRALLLLVAFGTVGCSNADSSVLADGRPADAQLDSSRFSDAGATPFDDAGEVDADQPITAPFVINEVAPQDPEGDWFELCNRTDAAVDLSGYTFTDDVLAQPDRGAFESGAVLPASGYLQVRVTSEAAGFGLGADEELGVYDSAGQLVDSVDWLAGDAPAGSSFARQPDCAGAFGTSMNPTPAAPN